VKRLLPACLGLMMLSCQGPVTERAPAASAKAVVAGYVENILNADRWEAYDQYFAPRVNFNGTPVGKADLQRRVASFRSAYPDFKMTIEDQIAEGDRVVTRMSCQGTHLGTDQGVPATGIRVTFTGLAIDRIQDGKVVEMWFMGDVWSRMQQIRSDL
jgi:steroid delta-isomerase-like uncharacterized protein